MSSLSSETHLVLVGIVRREDIDPVGEGTEIPVHHKGHYQVHQGRWEGDIERKRKELVLAVLVFPDIEKSLDPVDLDIGKSLDLVAQDIDWQVDQDTGKMVDRQVDQVGQDIGKKGIERHHQVVPDTVEKEVGCLGLVDRGIDWMVDQDTAEKEVGCLGLADRDIDWMVDQDTAKEADQVGQDIDWRVDRVGQGTGCLEDSRSQVAVGESSGDEGEQRSEEG